MTNLHTFTLDQLPAMPWKNGGGHTREIACWPPGAGLEDFGWRCSAATVDADGPFSIFAGIDRCILLLAGDGLHLTGEGLDHRLDVPLQPFAFPGEAAIACSRLGGTSTDFNLMTRRGRWQAELTVHEGAVHLPGAPHGLLLAASGAWRTGAAAPLAAGQGLWWADAVGPAEAVPDTEAGESRLIAIRLLPL